MVFLCRKKAPFHLFSQISWLLVGCQKLADELDGKATSKIRRRHFFILFSYFFAGRGFLFWEQPVHTICN